MALEQQHSGKGDFKVAHQLVISGRLHPEPTNPLTWATHGLIDPERAASATSVCNRFLAERSVILANTHLSAQGTAARISEAAIPAWENGVALTKKWYQLRDQHEADQAESSRVEPAADFGETLVDVELCRIARIEGKITTLLELESVRVRQAIARQPRELSGLDQAAHARIKASLVSAQAALDAENAEIALSAARDAIQVLLNTIAPLVDVPLKARKALIGPDFRA